MFNPAKNNSAFFFVALSFVIIGFLLRNVEGLGFTCCLIIAYLVVTNAPVHLGWFKWFDRKFR